MKKLIALVLVLAVLAGGLAGCENKPAGGSKPAGGTPAASPTNS